jgi:hypothetical protein
MRVTRFAAAIAVLVGMAGAANAETVMKQCGDQWQAAKANGTTNGETWPQFLSQCRAQLKGAGSAAAPAPAPQQQSGSLFPWQNPAPAATAAPTSNQSVMAACGEQWKQAKAAGTTGGATWPQFLKQCRTQMAGTGGGGTAATQGGFAPAAPAPAPAPAPQTGSLFPWQQPAAPAPAPAPANYGAPAPTAAGSSASAQQAQYRCPGATVVWVNEKSHIYHFPGTHDYGNTKRGEYMCEADAQAAGNRAAKNEHHP